MIGELRSRERIGREKLGPEPVREPERSHEDSRAASREEFTLLTEEDLYLFNEGSHLKLYEKLGAHPVSVAGAEGVFFAVFAPNALQVSVMGDFNGWSKESQPLRPRGQSGIWEGFLTGVPLGSAYKFHVVSRYHNYRVDKADPFALWAEWLRKELLVPVPHRHVVLTIPRLLRGLFGRRRELLTDLCRLRRDRGDLPRWLAARQRPIQTLSRGGTKGEACLPAAPEGLPGPEPHNAASHPSPQGFRPRRKPCVSLRSTRRPPAQPPRQHGPEIQSRIGLRQQVGFIVCFIVDLQVGLA